MKFLSLLWSLLRELSDESAYARYLRASGPRSFAGRVEAVCRPPLPGANIRTRSAVEIVAFA